MEKAARQKTRTPARRFLSLWDQQAYGAVRVGSALIKDRGNWRNLLTYFLPLHRTESSSFAAEADYGDIKILSRTLSLRKTKAVISRLLNKGVLHIPGLPPTPFEVTNISPPYRYYTWDTRFPILYPFREAQLHRQSPDIIEEPYRMVFASDLPLFPSIKAAVEEYLDTQLGDNTIGGSVFLLAPDYRARLWKLDLSSKGLRAEVQCPAGSKPEDLIGKVYVDFLPTQISDHGTLEIKDGFIEFPTQDFPSRAVVAVLDRKTGELIDYKDTQYRGLAGVSVTSTEQDLENLARTGESETLEYKSVLPKGHELAKTVVAFANQKGGRILVGVTNYSEIIGCDIKSDLVDQITRLIQAHCEPMPSITIEVVSCQEKNIVIIAVAEGSDKPYVAKEQGVYIRSLATSRIATRYELDHMQQSKLPGQLIRY